MSQSKFASITSSLLARKGEATPWDGAQKTLLSWTSDTRLFRPEQPSTIVPPERAETASPAMSPRLDEKSAAGCLKPVVPEKMKKCAVLVSWHDHDRLGILAVKSGTTRQHLMQDAVAQFLATTARPYEEKCPCLSKLECSSQQC